MAHSIYDTLTGKNTVGDWIAFIRGCSLVAGVSLDSPTVQSLLESQTLLTEVEQSALDQDEEDIFQCGKCKSQFTSLHMFILHKKEHAKVHEQTVDLSQYLVTTENQVVQTDDVPQEAAQYNPQEAFTEGDTLGAPIILEEADMLFSMDQGGTSYLASDASFNVPIILSADTLETFTNSVISSEEEAADGLKSMHQASQHDLCEEESTSITDDIDSDQNIGTDQENKTDVLQNLRYKCSYCYKQFAKKFYWQQHERSHTGEKPYQCVVCGRAFAQKSNVKKHMSSHKVWPGTAIHSLPPEAPAGGSIERSYHCQFCKEIFNSYKALKGHLIVSHTTLKVYKCVQSSCSMMFPELEDFLKHTRSHKRSEYRCHVCSGVFLTLSDLGLHQYTHSLHNHKTTEKYYCCSICKSSFSNLEALQHHMDTTTHDYACSHCGKSFPVERFLRRHLKTHATSARFACEDCGKAFKTDQYLANHRLIHSDETPFVCPHCPARFKRKDRLGRHMLIHDLTKRLKCPFRGYLGCMSEFSRPDKLKRHLLTHSNIKRFSCSQCNRNFHRAQALKHHELNKHSVKCDVCSHIFKTKEQLMTHNCDQSTEPKKHQGSQLPKKASGSFKPRKPTPKRQLPSKSTIGIAEKDKPERQKTDVIPRKVKSQLLVLDKSNVDSSSRRQKNILIREDILLTDESFVVPIKVEDNVECEDETLSIHPGGE